MKNKRTVIKSANYGIDGPVVLRNLVVIGIVAIGLGAFAYFQILPIRAGFNSVVIIFCTIIAALTLLVSYYLCGAARSVK